MPSDPQELRSLLALAVRAAHVGGEIALRHFGAAEAWRKTDGSVVTVADIEAEEAIVAELRRFDSHACILGEELGGLSEGTGGQQWVIDPIDGTAWYALGLPLFGVLVALLVDYQPVLGVIHLPALRRTVSAAEGMGCWHRIDQQAPVAVRVAKCTALGDATLSVAGLRATEIGSDAEEAVYRVGPLVRKCAALVTAGDCLQHSLVATGRIHIAVDPVMRPWDSAALIPCINEAGGTIGCLGNGKKPLAFAGSLVSASSPELLDAALQVMQSRDYT